MKSCPDCKGSGQNPQMIAEQMIDKEKTQCKNCKGEGFVPIDIETENLVYVPKNRKSTIERLLKENYTMRETVTLWDMYGHQVDMVCMSKEMV